MNAVEDVRYRQSSQFRFWSHTRAELASLRTQTNTLATTQISNRLTSAGAGQDGQPLPEFLTAAEELDLLKFFTVELLKAGEFCKMPTEVRATAAIFFRRFYVTNSVMTYSPTDLTKTCLFFGAKGEGQFHTLSKFAEMFPNTKAEEILAGEFLLCQGIRFCFDVRHPFRALDGAVLELNRLDADKKEQERIHNAHARARSILKFSPLITDAYFHFTPSQITYAALSMADYDIAKRLLENSFQIAAGNVPSGKRRQLDELQEKILATIEACRELLETEPPERQQEWWETSECAKKIRPLMRKLKKCRDPDRSDLVALQRARREQAIKKETKIKVENDDDVFGLASDSNRELKRRKVSSAVDDPFGPALG